MTTVKKPTATVRKRATPAKPKPDIPRVTAAKAGFGGVNEPWMTPAIKKARTAYYAKMVADINAAIEAAVARFKAEPEAEWAFHLHHEALLEKINGDYGHTGFAGAVERMKYVASGKGFTELLARFRVMRPVPRAKIEELQAASKAAVAVVEEKEPEHRITRAEVEKLGTVVKEKRKAVEALDPKTRAESARLKLTDAWSVFHNSRRAPRNYYAQVYSAGDQKSLDDLKKRADEWFEASNAKPDPKAVAAAKDALAAAEKAANALDKSYYKQEEDRLRAKRAAERANNAGWSRDTSRPEHVTDDQVWALHAEICEPDCPYTKTHKSVIPKK